MNELLDQLLEEAQKSIDDTETAKRKLRNVKKAVRQSRRSWGRGRKKGQTSAKAS